MNAITKSKDREMKACSRNTWRRGKKLGGVSAKVYLAVIDNNSNNDDNNNPAVKSSPLSNSVMLCRERLLLDKFKDCPYIIRSFGDDVTTENNEKIYNLFLEYASGGTLFGHLKGNGLPEYKVKRYAKSILAGLEYVHKKGYVHCNIKPENILLVEKESYFTTKISDFGLVKKAGTKESSMRGTLMYNAPETFIRKEFETKVDIWAFGCTVLQMLTGKTPWDRKLEFGSVAFRMVVKRETPEIPDYISAEARDFLEKCLMWDPEARWSAEMLLNHPFVKNISELGVRREIAAMADERDDELLIKPYFVLSDNKKRKLMEMIAEEAIKFGARCDSKKKRKITTMIPSVNTCIEIFN